MTEQELKNRIKSGDPVSLLLCGREEYLKRYYRGRLREIILSGGEFDSFNHIIVDGGADDFCGVLEGAVVALPFMQDRRIVELNGVSFDTLKENQIKNLIAVFDKLKDYPDTVLVVYADGETFDAGTLKRPSKLYTKLSAHIPTVLVDLRERGELSDWIKRHFSKEELAISDADAGYITDRCGRKMEGLVGEINKLICYAKAKNAAKITRQDIDGVTSVGEKDDNFALSNAVRNSDMQAAFDAIAVYKSEKEPPSIPLSIISKTYIELLRARLALRTYGGNYAAISKLLGVHEYVAKLSAASAARYADGKLEEIISLCEKADSELKSRFSDYTPLERLLAAISAEVRRP